MLLFQLALTTAMLFMLLLASCPCLYYSWSKMLLHISLQGPVSETMFPVLLPHFHCLSVFFRVDSIGVVFLKLSMGSPHLILLTF